MIYDYLWDALIGLMLALACVCTLLLNIWYEQARWTAEAKMTPEERKEREVFSKAARKGWCLLL